MLFPYERLEVLKIAKLVTGKKPRTFDHIRDRDPRSLRPGRPRRADGLMG